jgi:hypothetical protein
MNGRSVYEVWWRARSSYTGWDVLHHHILISPTPHPAISQPDNPDPHSIHKMGFPDRTSNSTAHLPVDRTPETKSSTKAPCDSRLSHFGRRDTRPSIFTERDGTEAPRKRRPWFRASAVKTEALSASSVPQSSTVAPGIDRIHKDTFIPTDHEYAPVKSVFGPEDPVLLKKERPGFCRSVGRSLAWVAGLGCMFISENT